MSLLHDVPKAKILFLFIVENIGFGKRNMNEKRILYL